MNLEACKLTDEENTRIFETQIAPEQFGHVPSQDEPSLTIVMGQPGSGKTQICDRLIGPELDEYGPFANIDSDIYKRYHPLYQELMEKNDQAMATLLFADGRQWADRAYDYSRENRLNVLAQATVTKPDEVVNKIKSYRHSDYHVRLVAIAVSEALSRQGILARYVSEVQAEGRGRLTATGKTEQSLVGIAMFAEALKHEPLADELTIVHRLEADRPPINVHPLDFAETLASTQNHPLSKRETAYFFATQVRLETELGREQKQELALIRQLARPLLNVLSPLSST